jgi:glycosyltransferase involved in cell wall biosynthesis
MLRKYNLKKNAAFLYSIGPHPTTKSCIESLNIPKSQWYRLTKSNFFSPFSELIRSLILAFKIPKYKYYFIEGSIALQIAFFKKFLRREKPIVISRINDDLFNMDLKKNPIKKFWYKTLINTLDGAICIANLVQQEAKKIRPDLPTGIARSFLHNDDYFFNIKPNFNSKKILFVGHYRPHKGVENLIKGFLLFHKENPEYEFILVGRRIPSLRKKFPQKCLHFNDAVFDIVKYSNLFADAKAYLHCPVYEAGPRTIFESMACGVIPLVSEMAGNKDLLVDVDKKLILKNNNPEIIAKGLDYVINLPLKKLKNHSKLCRAVIEKGYTFKKGTDTFKKQVTLLLESIENKK